MKSLHLSMTAVLIAAAISCSRSPMPSDDVPADFDGRLVNHGEIVLGDRLENPYSVENVKSAFESLYPTKASSMIVPTDLYVRFLPADDGELSLLKDSGVVMVDHPVDFEIVKEGDYYHDPSIPEEGITWQYCVVPADFVFPDIRYEILEKCYLAEHDATRSFDGVDWEAVEAEAFRLSGNESMLVPDGRICGCADDVEMTKGQGSINPSGRICISDEEYNGGEPFGVAGVRVQCNVFVKFSSADTDRNGYYTIPKKFTASPRYRLVFKNSKGFSIGFNTILYPASVSTLGKNTPSGINVNIDKNSERKLFRRCVANNALYDLFERCSADDLCLPQPPSDLVLWMFEDLDASSAVMLHHGTFLDGDSLNKYFRIAAAIIRFFGPDLTVGTKGLDTYRKIYSATVHEAAHSIHFNAVGADYWNKYISYVVGCTIRGLDVYGDESQENAGYCGIGEMWAYYMESKLVKERYKCANPAFGSSYWFHPQIMTYLEDRGIEAKDICKALTPEVTSIQKLREKLVELYPESMMSVNQVFNRYE